VLERLSAGFNGLRVKLGGMVTGGGFGFGPEYFREDLLDGRMSFRAAAQTSVKNYQRYEAEWIVPSLAAGRAFASVRGVHHNYRGLNYYGPGADSKKSGRSNYHLEDTGVDGVVGVRPRRRLTVGGSAGYALFNIGPGTDRRFVSTERIYTPAQAPGIDVQSDFARYGAFAEYDWRDDPFGAKHGGKYVFQYARYSDRKLGLHDFGRMEIDLHQYIGLANRRRVFALRARTVLTDTEGGNTVPFYLQPEVGGSDDLRGFRPFRFTGDNSLVLNGEYRWEAFSGLDMALFADGGKVFQRRGLLNFRDLEGSWGFGFRFNARNRTFLRLDVGFSREGFQVWFKFNDIFAPRRLGTAGSQPVI
jgi:outer membrane protein assembly factor BamA